MKTRTETDLLGELKFHNKYLALVSIFNKILRYKQNYQKINHRNIIWYKIFMIATFSILLCIFMSGQNVWTQISDIDTFNREQSVGFSVNGKGYIVTGHNCFGSYYNDLLEYNPIDDSWVEKAEFPGSGNNGAECFSIGSFGYVVCGRIDMGNMSQELWEYDPSIDTWTQKESIPAPGRCLGFSFSIGSKGYVGAGWDDNFNYLQDFWEWDQSSDTWTQKANFGGGSRSRGTGFSIGTKGYAGLGFDNNNTLKDDFWRYDPTEDTWIQISDYSGGPRSDVASFTICSKGYIAQGQFGPGNDLWEYDPALNLWTQKAQIGGSAREEACAFSIENKGYVGTGVNESFNCLNSFWEYTPDSCIISGINEINHQNTLFIHPNPFSVEVTITTANRLNNAILTIYNSTSQQVKKITDISGQTILLHRGSLPCGIYFIQLKQDTKILATNKIIIID